jgi:Bax protein
MNQFRKILNAFHKLHVPAPWRGHGILLAVVLGAFALSLLAPRQGEEKMPDFRPLETQQRKVDFFGFLTPIVASVNAHIARQKVRLQSVAARVRKGKKLSWSDRRWIRDLGRRYKVPFDDGITKKAVKTLQLRVDVVPEPLVLVQAAKESGWGTSRFAVQGNNLFGQRCYSRGCGIAPKKAANSARFGVARYDSVRDSVSSYIRNLNTHPQYRGFRELRKSLRDDNRPLNPLVLAGGLDDYSERGQDYVSELKALIRQNHGVEDD